MRIISGSFKSRLIQYPKIEATRPLSDRMKETIFNVLGDAVQDQKVLDLYAGSGSFGLEAISRGARRVYFVDEEKIACQVIRENLRSLGIDTGSHPVFMLPITRALKNCQNHHEKFNLIFVDPPYNKGLVKKTLRQLERFDIVQKFGKIIIHRSHKEDLPTLEKFQLIKEKQIGQAFVDFLEFNHSDPQTSHDDQQA